MPFNKSQITKVAALVHRHLRRNHSRLPSITTIASILDVAFFASLKTDEERRVVCTLTFVDLSDPAGKNPPVIRPQRRSFVPFGAPMSFTVKNVAKLSQATPPWASCVAIGTKRNKSFICGLFDQEVHYRNSLNHEGDERFDRPGLFQIEILGLGSLAVYDDWRLIAALNQDSVTSTFHDVLYRGPVSNILGRYIEKSATQAKKLFRSEGVVPTEPWQPELWRLWVQTVSRILLNLKRAGHGGAVLLIPDMSTEHLAVKYALNYSKLDSLLPQHVVAEISEREAWLQIHDNYLEKGADLIPYQLNSQETCSSYEKDDAIHGELGSVNFIASLGRVDGLVLLAGGLIVRGFGVEITELPDPPRIFVAGDAKATKSRLKRIDFQHFGTRHRSMMRYCHKHPGSVGFVISQDGDIRAITSIGGNVVMWENIRLQAVDID